MAEAQQEILWRPDADFPEDDLTRPSLIKYHICDLCRSALTSLEILHPPKRITDGVPLCGGTLKETPCSLRAMLLHFLNSSRNDPRIKTYNDKWPDYESMNGHMASVSSGERAGLTILYVSGREDSDRRLSLRFHSQAYLGDPAAQIISSRPFIEDLGSQEALDQMNHWINECEQSHPGCGQDSAATATLPSRVIDVELLNIRQTSEGESGKYAALTYCWGRGTIPGALVKANRLALMESIRPESLPQTVKDAIFVTKKLGLKYIWIDAYCIIQDSVEDKNKELACMAEIYSRAHVTLSASAAATVLDGFLAKRQPRARSDQLVHSPYPYPRLTVPFHIPNGEGVMGTAIFQEGGGTTANSEDPIMKRSWTFQERLLSRRILIFGTHELSWQCNGAERSCGKFQETGEFRRPSFLSAEGHRRLPGTNFEKDWDVLVQHYSARDITHDEDKLVALAGVASKFAEAQGGKDTYLAGLWMSRIHRELVWMAMGLERSRPSVYVAPSWSWASVKCSGGVMCLAQGQNVHQHVEIIDCETTLKTSELPYGQVTGGRIRLRGRLRPVLQPHPEIRSENEQDTSSSASPSTSSTAESEGWETETDEQDLAQELDGRLRWDVETEPHDPTHLFHLRVGNAFGLVLFSERPGVFRRVGLFRSNGTPSADKFWAISTLEDIEII